MRLNQALFLLKNSDYGIATIAAKVGYHNSGHFAKLFKNAYGEWGRGSIEWYRE
ncbi:MAG: helix-turn-helix domain-containing protein [Eisenbergiella sp.]